MEKAASLPMSGKTFHTETFTSSRLPTIPASQNMFLNIFYVHLSIRRWTGGRPPNSTQRNEIARAVSRWPSFCLSKVAWIEGLHRGPRAALRGGECQEARAQVRQRRFAAAHYEDLNLPYEGLNLMTYCTAAPRPTSRMAAARSRIYMREGALLLLLYVQIVWSSS